MGKLPAHFGPLSFVFTGSGNVSQVRQGSNSFINTSDSNKNVSITSTIWNLCKFHK